MLQDALSWQSTVSVRNGMPYAEPTVQLFLERPGCLAAPNRVGIPIGLRAEANTL